jgi:hypothetical protein
MAVDVENISYITNTNEVFELADEYRIKELASLDDPDIDPTGGVLAESATERLYRALNWGRQQIDNFLRNVYPVDKTRGLVETVDSTHPGEAVKLRNVRLAEFFLTRKRLPLEEELKLHEALNRDLRNLSKADTHEILGDQTRSEQILPIGTAHQKPEITRDKQSVFDTIEGASYRGLGLEGEVD